MKKGKFQFIVISMSIALAGLILLQAYWIKHDFESKAKQFDGTVMMAMNKIVEQVEEMENRRLVVNNFISLEDSNITFVGLNDSLLHIISSVAMEPPLPPPPPPGPPSPARELDEAITKKFGKDKLLQKSWNPDGEMSFLHLDSTIDIRIEKNIEQREIIDLSFNRRRNELNPMDDPIVDQNSALEERKIALVEKRMKTKMKKLNSIMQKLTFQIVDPQGNIFNRISKRNLDSIVMAEIKNHDLELDYKYGVFQKNIPKALLLTNKDDSLPLINSPYQLSLFPNDIINKSEVLCLDFNNKFNYILGSMFLMLLFSLLFTGIIITGFGYTLFVIQQQKKLAIIKNDFINNMTHEFKTPIATIAIANESIQDPRVSQSPDKLVFYTGIIKDENERMLRQVETVLQMAQIDKGEIKINKENIGLKEVIESAAASMQLPVQQREGHITIDWEGNDVQIYADPNHIMNVFINLLDNANKYSPEAPAIRVHVYSDSSKVTIAIQDKGIGMSKEVSKRVFETFFRATSGNIHDVKGFGLGLSYVKAIVDMHNGQIEVQSELGKGSSFIIRLPILENEKA
ncbi:MAG: HAMP domain-containing histidine kinase [Bacteroidetes bacterium]|nr:HAMP domain-containing histidine kinase [Bacteroidota bacterium]